MFAARTRLSNTWRCAATVVAGSATLMVTGCATPQIYRGTQVATEETNAVVRCRSIGFDTEACRQTGSIYRVVCTGVFERAWQERPVFKEMSRVRERSADEVTFRRLTGKYKPMSFTADYGKDGRFFSFAEKVGWFPMTQTIIEKDIPFKITKEVGFFKWTRKFWKRRKHIVLDDRDFIISPVLPNSLVGVPLFLGAWVASPFMIVYGVVVWDTEVMGNGFMALLGAPVAAVACLGTDIGIHGGDLLCMTGALVYDGSVLVVVGAGDTAAMGGALTADLATGAGVVAGDAVVSGLALGADGVAATGDSMYPATVKVSETETGGLVPDSLWHERASSDGASPDFPRFQVSLSIPGRGITNCVPLDALGRADFDLRRLAPDLVPGTLDKARLAIRDEDGRVWQALDEVQVRH